MWEVWEFVSTHSIKKSIWGSSLWEVRYTKDRFYIRRELNNYTYSTTRKGSVT